MLYVQQSLGPDEQLVHVGEFHWMHTVTAVMSIVWSTLAAILFIGGSVYMSVNMGEMPRGIGWLDGVRLLHPGLRIFAFLIFVFGLYQFASMMIEKATTEIAITDSRLIYKRGLIARHIGEISIDRIEGVNVLQSLLGRLLGYGRLAIRGMGVGEVVLPPIENPVGFRKAIQKAKTLCSNSKIPI